VLIVINAVQTELHVANNEVRRLEEEYNALGDKKHLTAKKTSIAAGISSNRPDLAQLKVRFLSVLRCNLMNSL
jgi:hypothetical protein